MNQPQVSTPTAWNSVGHFITRNQALKFTSFFMANDSLAEIIPLQKKHNRKK